MIQPAQHSVLDSKKRERNGSYFLWSQPSKIRSGPKPFLISFSNCHPLTYLTPFLILYIWLMLPCGNMNLILSVQSIMSYFTIWKSFHASECSCSPYRAILLLSGDVPRTTCLLSLWLNGSQNPAPQYLNVKPPRQFQSELFPKGMVLSDKCLMKILKCVLFFPKSHLTPTNNKGVIRIPSSGITLIPSPERFYVSRH